jgi:hypothetical protein
MGTPVIGLKSNASFHPVKAFFPHMALLLVLDPNCLVRSAAGICSPKPATRRGLWFGEPCNISVTLSLLSVDID